MTFEEQQIYKHQWYVKNRERVREKDRLWKAKNPEKVNEHNRRWQAKRRDKHRQIKSEIGCARCRTTDPRILDFHHRNPADKKFTIGKRATANPQIFLEEIMKCDVLCSNCHRIVEWEKRHDAS